MSAKLKTNFEGKTKIPNGWGIKPELQTAINEIKEIQKNIDKKLEDLFKTCSGVSKADKNV